MMDYRITEKAPFTIVGVKRPFNSDTSYDEIPKFWNEWLAKGEDRPVRGTFGVCADMKGKDFDYWIADLYFPWEDVPEGCETRVIPGSLWAQFPCTVRTLQDTNTKIWSEWLPALRGYALAGEYDIEVYLPPEEGCCKKGKGGGCCHGEGHGDGEGCCHGEGHGHGEGCCHGEGEGCCKE